MRLIQLIILIVPFCLCAPVMAEEELVTPEVIEVVQADVAHGKKIFESICMHCHRTDYESSVVGAPGLKDVLERHSVEWINTWIRSPEAFSKVNSTAKDLLESNPYGLIMPTIPEMQDEQNRKDIIEYLKTLK